MSDPNNIPSTEGWRKNPKGPNFLGIVIGSCAVIILLLIVAWFVLRADGMNMIPHGPSPQPNSLLQDPIPGSPSVANVVRLT